MNRKRTSIAAATALLAVSGIVSAADGPSFTLEVTPLSQYVWRGLVLTNGPVLRPRSPPPIEARTSICSPTRI